MSKTGFKGAFGARHFEVAARHFAARASGSRAACELPTSSLRAADKRPTSCRQAAYEQPTSGLRAAYELPTSSLQAVFRAPYEQPTSSLRGCIPNTLRAPYEQPARLPASQQLASPPHALRLLAKLPLGPRIDTVSKYRILAYVSNLGL